MHPDVGFYQAFYVNWLQNWFEIEIGIGVALYREGVCIVTFDNWNLKLDVLGSIRVVYWHQGSFILVLVTIPLELKPCFKSVFRTRWSQIWLHYCLRTFLIKCEILLHVPASDPIPLVDRLTLITGPDCLLELQSGWSLDHFVTTHILTIEDAGKIAIILAVLAVLKNRIWITGIYEVVLAEFEIEELDLTDRVTYPRKKTGNWLRPDHKLPLLLILEGSEIDRVLELVGESQWSLLR